MARTEPFVSVGPGAVDLPYQGVGAELRAAREAVGRSADLVASTLRIRRPHIQAIEEGRFQDLPGQVYAVGFIRAYAEYLGLDSDLVIARFRQEADGPSAKLELHFPEPASRRARLDVRALIVGLIIAVGAYGTWNYVQTRGQLPRELVATVPPNLLVTSADDATVVTPDAALAEISPLPDAETPTGPLASGLDSAITAVETRQAATADLGVADPAQGSDLASPAMMGNTAGDAPGMARPGRARTDSQVPRPDDAQWLPDDRIEIAAGGSLIEPADVTVPSEEAVSAVMVAAIEPKAASAVAIDPDTQLPPMSDTLDGYRLGESDAVEPGNATAITGALAETPEAPTLLENELPPLPTAPSTIYEPRVYGQVNTDARVVVRARIESWVQIEGSGNELLLTRVLNPGDMFLVPNRGDLNLVTGNAGGIEILVDGVLMPPLGPEGTVRRNVLLTPDALTGADTVSSR